MSNGVKKYIDMTGLFNRNLTAKIVSVVFALVMWLYVMGEVNPQMITELTNVKVQLLNVEELRQSGLVLMGQEDYTVNVKIEGRRNDVFGINPDSIVVRADLRGFKAGVNSVDLEISSPANVTIKDISPKQIKVTLDEVVKRQKPVSVNIIGAAAEGYEPADATTVPSEVIVEGPQTLVNAVAAVVAEINVKDSAVDLSDKLPLKPVNSEGKGVNGVEVKSKYVEVSLPIHKVEEAKIELDLQGVPKEGYKITDIALQPEKVVVKGPKDKTAGIATIKTSPVNIEGIQKSVDKPLNLLLPDGVTVPYLEKNPVVKITVEQILSKEFTFKKEDVAIDNLKEKLAVDLSKTNDTIKVNVEAVESIINSITKEDLQLYIDASGLTEGRYEASIGVYTPLKVEKITVTPVQMEFEIKHEQTASNGNENQ
ncbi:MAG: YbbR-like domain-containing protein [Bacillota bacterium]